MLTLPLRYRRQDILRAVLFEGALQGVMFQVAMNEPLSKRLFKRSSYEEASLYQTNSVPRYRSQ